MLLDMSISAVNVIVYLFNLDSQCYRKLNLKVGSVPYSLEKTMFKIVMLKYLVV